MISRLAALSSSLVLFFVAFPLISFGTTTGSPILWWLGLAALGVGGLIPPARRFLAQGRAPSRPRPTGLCEDERVS